MDSSIVIALVLLFLSPSDRTTTPRFKVVMTAVADPWNKGENRF